MPLALRPCVQETRAAALLIRAVHPKIPSTRDSASWLLGAAAGRIKRDWSARTGSEMEPITAPTVVAVVTVTAWSRALDRPRLGRWTARRHGRRAGLWQSFGRTNADPVTGGVGTSHRCCRSFANQVGIGVVRGSGGGQVPVAARAGSRWCCGFAPVLLIAEVARTSQ